MKMSHAALALMLVSASVYANPVRDPAASVRVQESEARIAPNDGGAAIELADAYRAAGRAADANTAYRRALVLDNVMLETREGDAVWSHDVARQALAKDALASLR